PADRCTASSVVAERRGIASSACKQKAHTKPTATIVQKLFFTTLEKMRLAPRNIPLSDVRALHEPPRAFLPPRTVVRPWRQPRLSAREPSEHCCSAPGRRAQL